MKSIILCIGLLLSQTNPDREVYVCISPTAYAYHSTLDCRGLKNCTHRIEAMSLLEAQKDYRRKPCGYCWR